MFCGQDPLSGDLELDRTHLAKLREDHDEISFIGGEPSLDPRLVKAVESARELGFTAVGVQTNGYHLAHTPELFTALVDAGLSDLHLSIHGPSAAAHDYHSGRPGSLAAAIGLLARAQRADLTVVVTTVVTRSNFRELAKMPPALKRRGVAAWLLEPVRPYGRAADGFARLVPRFGMALPWALHALEQARRHALSAWIRGAPLCALGPFAASALASEPRSYPAPCEGCPARPRCVGVDPAYAEVFGHQELKPGPARPPAEFDEGRTRLMRMFVGVGELVERPPQLRSPGHPSGDPAEDPAANKRRLPVLTNDPASRAASSSDE
ncbi:pyrroloquinoline quinone biosynthesis protein PqqE [Enhygromyxa salina]|uniref:Pyrroloquinoline quinone biosynthesis protein PqqE n=1 Tax=Enhygromyxa salina TaxID=215803 RepID=A0A2S9XJR6_9BACT|nr:pyrroloquinoline quinone biosynthesis protein PqqE [Enhygromyxa salina]